MTDAGWREYKHAVKEHVNETAEQMIASDEEQEWHDHAFHVLADLLMYREQVKVRELRDALDWVPLGDTAEA